MTDRAIILLSDLRDQRARKDQELAFYAKQLEKLKVRLALVSHEIAVTEAVMRLIETERVLTPNLQSKP